MEAQAMDRDPKKEFLDNTGKFVRLLRKLFDARARSMDLTYSRARALLEIERREGATQTELAEALEIGTPSVNRILDGLEDSGLVERRAQEGDKRTRQLFLTPLARARGDRILTFTEDLKEELFDGISEDDLLTASRVLEQVTRNLESGRS
ncbi:MarR family winged helix-turn-helix transcriptional regulator [Actibacterium sp. D379-3]